MDSKVTIRFNKNVMHVDFVNKKIILERSFVGELDLGLLPMEIKFSDITDIEISKPSLLSPSNCCFILNGIRYLTQNSIYNMTQFPTRDFSRLEATLSRVLSECNLSGFKDFGSVKAKKVVFMTVINEFETRKRCDNCGEVFCYTPLDVAKNYRLSWSATLSSINRVGNILGGTNLGASMSAANTNTYTSQIRDFDVCPNCHSRNLTIIEKGKSNESAQTSRTNKVGNVVSPISVTEDLKKFKELLDMGIITQEEFDAKKKQLLNL